MTGSVTWLIICILFSMGISLNGTTLGKGLAEAIDEASKNGTYTCSDETMDEAKQIIDEYFDPTNPKYWIGEITESDLEKLKKLSSNVPLVDIENSIGIDAWKDFINNHQNNVQTVGSFSSGDYSFKYGVYYSFDKQKYRSTTYPYVEIYYKGELLRTMNGTSYTTNQMNQIKHDEIRSYYNEMRKTIYYDDENKAVIVATVSIPPQQFLLGSYIKDDVINFADSIGSITDATIAGTKIGQLPIAADGSVTLPDGTKVYPNSDGTYNIDNSVYSPTYNIGAYDDSALLELLQQILQKIDSLEGQLEFEKDTATDEELEEKLEEAAEEAQSYTGSLSEFMLNSAITKVFPFCLPFDFVRGVKLFNASPQTPVFTYSIKIPAVGSFAGTQIEITIDFSRFETLAFISRWVSTVGFAFSLIFISTKIVKGAGA